MKNKTLNTIGVDPLIREFMEKRQKVKQELMNIVSAVQAECEHEVVFECDYKEPTTYSRYEYPVRTCVKCRLREERSCCGWKTLTNDRKTVFATREQLSDLIIHY